MAQIRINSPLQSLNVPEQYRGHSLLREEPFFTLPVALLNHVLRTIDRTRFDEQVIKMEYALSAICQDHSTQIGFWRDVAINYLLLRPSNIELDDEQVDFLATARGLNREQIRRSITVGNNRLRWITTVRRGYCGWLMTNPQFVREHAEIFHRHADMVRDVGVPMMGNVALGDVARANGVQQAEGLTRQMLLDFENFFIRWRLEGMPAPKVPEPLAPRLPAVNVRTLLGHMQNGGKTFFLPDILPIPSRDEFRNLLEDSLRQPTVDHLDSWMKLVRARNPARNQLHRYARIFELQHYWKTLHRRHPTALRRKTSSLVVALSAFLQVSESSIASDLRFISSRLGPGWHLRD